MPKLKPKKILSRVLRGKSRKRKDAVDYLSSGFEHYLLGLDSQPSIGSDNDDTDGRSITSFSTTATADNLPGTGRIIDTYIYQPVGRRIERLAMRVTISSLHPAHIAQYIEANYTYFNYMLNDMTPLNNATAKFCIWHYNGSTIIAGMKSLVKQTQCVP